MAINACSGWDNSECKGTPVLIHPYRTDDRDALFEMYDAIEDSTMGLPSERRDTRERWLDRLASDG